MLMVVAFLLLRISIAWMFLSAVPTFISKWKVTLQMVKLLFSKYVTFFSVMMIATMIVGSFSILFGIYAQIGAFLLFIQCTLGVFVHNKFANNIARLQLSDAAEKNDQRVFGTAKSMGVVGHKTSAQKNIVLAAVMIFIVVMGSGPLSVTGNLF